MIFQNTLDETTKIGNNRMTNPWDVDSLQAFLTLKCPECDFCTDTETLFQAHAVANHPLCLGNLLKRIDNFSGAAFKVLSFLEACFYLIPSSSLSMKIQIMGRKITENLGFKSPLRKVNIFLFFFIFIFKFFTQNWVSLNLTTFCHLF